MKQILFSILLAAFSLPLFSQVEFGLKTGVHTFDLNEVGDLTFDNGDVDVALTPLDAQYGFQFGLYSRIKLGGVYVEPGLLLNSSRVNYTLTTSDTIEDVISERFLNLDVPVLLGVKLLKVLRLQAGPVGHITLNRVSDLVDFENFGERLEGLELGFQAGIGIDIASLRFDLLYEGNLNKFGNHITIADEELSFAQSAPRLVFNIGYRF